MAKTALKKKSRRPAAKAQSIKNTVETYKRKNFKIPFETAVDAIDLRTMSQNYASSDGIIPLDDIHKLLRVMLGPNYGTDVFDYDPSLGTNITHTNVAPNPESPQFMYVDWDELYLWTVFQRDVAPNHTKSIDSDFDHSCVIIPCAIRLTVKGKLYYCVWDGHHTLQVCRLRGYDKFGIWFIDIDNVPAKVIYDAGKCANENVVTDEERIKYGIWLAGKNMIRINAKNKRKLNPYDQFMIELDIEDQFAVDMNRILVKNKCTPKRHANSFSGAFTQIKSGIECYELEHPTAGTRGLYWDRALRFHRKTWPRSPLILEVFRPLSILYYEAAAQDLNISAQFDKDLAKLLKRKFGHADGVQEKIKDSYWTAIDNKQGNGIMPDHDKRRVLSGIINVYNQSNLPNKVRLPDPDYVWNV
jgi:hypothetical protein